MNPDQLSAKGTESGHQKALFAWAAMAERNGFKIANDMNCYTVDGLNSAEIRIQPVPCLAWLHSIPNGGLRDAKTAALMKAEGARSGVADVFLPVPSWKHFEMNADGACHGLYIEMKTTTGKQSEAQEQFQTHCENNCYLYEVCRSWREAAKVIQDYLL